MLHLVPSAPDFALDIPVLRRALDFFDPLYACPQDPEWHAEGDVGVHTEMVLEALVGHERWRQLPEADRATVFLAALMHDVAKPSCTKTEPDGRISARGHSRRGSHHARALLWRTGLAPSQREQVAALIMHHQVPFFLVDQDDAERRAITVGQTAPTDLLELVAWADAKGRRCEDQARLIDNCWLFGELCRELNLDRAPFQFPDDHTRFVYFRDAKRSPRVAVHDDRRLTVTVMSGLPGAGKDTFVRTLPSQPVVSLDALRDELDIDPAATQGVVIQAARERAREYLRAERDFIWNATNVSRLLRKQVVDFLAGYGARVHIVHLEAPPDRLRSQNRERREPVPQNVIDRLVGKWSVPDLTEAHRLTWVADETRHQRRP